MSLVMIFLTKLIHLIERTLIHSAHPVLLILNKFRYDYTFNRYNEIVLFNSIAHNCSGSRNYNLGKRLKLVNRSYFLILLDFNIIQISIQWVLILSPIEIHSWHKLLCWWTFYSWFRMWIKMILEIFIKHTFAQNEFKVCICNWWTLD